VPDKDNTAAQDDLPEKYRGKSVAEIAKMHEEAERRLGEQGTELGNLRAQVTASRVEPQPDRKADDDDDTKWVRKYADDLILEPERVLPLMAREMEDRVSKRVADRTSRQVSNAQTVETFFRANPDLEKFREVVSIIGERIYQNNPGRSMAEILEMTKAESVRYLADIKTRLDGKPQDKTAGVTTSGSTKSREGEVGEVKKPVDEVSSDKQAILDEIRAIRDGRAKKIAPPRTR